MTLYRYTPDRLEPITRTTLAREGIRERDDLQRLLRADIGILGEDLLVIAEEYALFADSRRRIDLLAIDRTGSLVVIELKRTEGGGHLELQALRYAAMVSTMTFEQLVSAYSHYNNVDPDAGRASIIAHVEADEPAEQLSNQVRIILVSGDFSTEITSTVLWLNDNYNLDVTCYRLSAYKLDGSVILDLQRIIPLPEATEYQIHQRAKVVEAAAARAATGRDTTTRYDLWIGENSWARLSKQGAVKTAVTALWAAGVPLSTIQACTYEARWTAVHPQAGETVEAAFVRQNPGSSPSHRWFDLEVVDGDVHWVMPRFGGLDTENILQSLQVACAPTATLRWSRSPLPDEPIG